jgi:putative redox protein
MNDQIKATAKIGKEHYQTIVSYRDRSFLADEPASENGTDTGPTPDELLVGSLASCTAITLRMYADRKEWPLNAINVSVSLHRSKESTTFDIEISYEGEINQEQKDRLIQIANLCPVHKVLANPIILNTTIT